MKTNTEKNTKSELKNRPEPRSTEQQKSMHPMQIDFTLRKANRSLDTEKLLALLKSKTPKLFELAEVVGKWVWSEFTEKQPAAITCVLAQLGFHWNKMRQAWQHPCGMFRDRSVKFDPRRKYGSYFAASKPALNRSYYATKFATTDTRNATREVVRS